jgi:hypothetical protein
VHGLRLASVIVARGLWLKSCESRDVSEPDLRGDEMPGQRIGLLDGA